MAEYIEREAALGMLNKSLSFCENELDLGAYRTGCISATRDDIGNIKHIPAADVVEVVRCKDCQHWKSIKYEIGLSWAKTKGRCSALYNAHNADMCLTDEEHFCGYGAKMGGKGDGE